MLNVIVPSYNHELYIYECLRSLTKIDKIKVNIIVVDDCSSDKTVYKVERFIAENKSDVSIKLIKKEVNKGVVDSLNLGISNVNKGYVYLIASDDVVNPAAMMRAIETIEQNQNYKFVISNGYNFCKERIISEVYSNKLKQFLELPPKVRRNKLFTDYPKPLLLQSTLFKYTSLAEVGFWNQNVILDDYSMFVKLFNKLPVINYDFCYLQDNFIVNYRAHEGNSYSNIQRQYAIVKQFFLSETPPKILHKSLGSRLSFYVLISLKNRQYTDVYSLVRGESFRTMAWATLFAPIYIIRKLMKVR
ncbi:TPA: glycosyltransferase family 2 protein [Vibrio fluvialis]|nr:glycosyltransferase family 2 protein [Vibrio fluvialis]